MRVLALSPSARSDKSYLLGLGVVVAFAAAQLSVVTYHYGGKFLAARRAARPPVVAPAPTEAPAPAVAETSPGERAAQPAATVAAPAATGNRLLTEARTLRQKQDTTNALAKLQEAARAEPKNAEVLAEMAGV